MLLPDDLIINKNVSKDMIKIHQKKMHLLWPA